VMRKIEKKTLKTLGFTRVFEAEDGKAAIALLEADAVDLIISDWNMPNMDGFQLLQWVRAEERFRHIPFLMATGQGDKTQEQKAVDAGVSSFVAKPFNEDELRARIRVADRIVTIQSSLNSSLEELREALDMVQSFEEPVAICTKCQKIGAFDGSWRKPSELLEYPVDPRFVQLDCKNCKS